MRLRMDTAGRTRITQLIRYHDLPIAPEPKPIRRLMHKLGVEPVRQLFALHIADTCGQSAICAGRVQTYQEVVFGLYEVPLVGYQGHVIPVIIAVWVMCFLEKRLHKIVPPMFDLFVTPLVSVFVTGYLTLAAIGPLFTTVETCDRRRAVA